MIFHHYHRQVVPNLYEFLQLYSKLNTKENILKNVTNQTVVGHH